MMDRLSHVRRRGWLRAVLAITIVIPVSAGWAATTPQVPTTTAAPVAPAAPNGAPDPKVEISPAEIARLRALYREADAIQRAELDAYYKDLGVDLAKLLGISEEMQAQDALATTVRNLLVEGALSRSLTDMLRVRTELASEVGLPRVDGVTAAELATWLRQRAIAGDWSNIAIVFEQLPRTSVQAIAGGLFEALAKTDAQLLPEEVLDVALVLPEAPSRVHVAQLARMLVPAARRHGTVPLLEALRRGNRQFRIDDEESRRRIVELLTLAGLVREAYEFLPPLEKARESGDAEIVLAHAVYQADMADSMAEGPDADIRRREAFGLLREVVSMSSASQETRRASIVRGASLMSKVPLLMVDPWLESLFADAGTTQLAAEVFALEATRAGEKGRSADERSAAIVRLAHAATVMLDAAEQDALRVPLRMLAVAIVQEIEAAAEKLIKDPRSYSDTSELRRLLSAAPGEKWLSAIDRSVASRASHAMIAGYVLIDDMDRAIASLRDGITRSRADGPRLAEHLLTSWRTYLGTIMSRVRKVDYGWGEYDETVTRGYQRRRLAALKDVIAIMSEMGVDAKELAPTADLFMACHQADEIFRHDDVERAFGPLEGIPPLTCVTLAERMRANILRYWDARIQPPKDGRPRTPTSELKRSVDNGYATAFKLIESAERTAPDLWQIDAVRASLAYDQLQLNKRLGLVEQGRELELTSRAYAAFERAAEAYAAALNRNERAESADVYGRWFRAALGASDVSALRAETLPAEDSQGAAQFERIHRAIEMLPPDAAERHTENFVEEITTALDEAPPGVKPRLVRSALRVVADHPSGRPLKALATLHEELASEEIKLRFAIDGSERVQVGKPFMVLLSVRFTNAVSRSSGGFARYLQSAGWDWRRDRQVDYKHDLDLAVRQSFSKGFEVRGINFFSPNTMPHGVIESGADGWLEQPLLVAYVAAKDASVDRLPQVDMQVFMQDQHGEVAVVLQSNTPALSASAEPSPRRAQELEVTQTLDARNMHHAERPEVILQVAARGRGTIPDLDELLVGYRDAVPGYSLVPDAADAGRIVFIGEKVSEPGAAAGSEPVLPELDELGVIRPRVERAWQLRYTPSGSAAGDAFTFPTLAAAVPATLVSKVFDDTDVEVVSGATVALVPSPTWHRYALALMGVVVLAALLSVVMIRRRRRSRGRQAAVNVDTTGSIGRSPGAAIIALRRLHREAARRSDFKTQAALEQDIAAIERGFFSRMPTDDALDALSRAASRWDAAASRLRRHRTKDQVPATSPGP